MEKASKFNKSGAYWNWTRLWWCFQQKGTCTVHTSEKPFWCMSLPGLHPFRELLVRRFPGILREFTCMLNQLLYSWHVATCNEGEEPPTHQLWMDWLSLRKNNWLLFTTSGNMTGRFERNLWNVPQISKEKTRKIATCGVVVGWSDRYGWTGWVWGK